MATVRRPLRHGKFINTGSNDCTIARAGSDTIVTSTRSATLGRRDDVDLHGHAHARGDGSQPTFTGRSSRLPGHLGNYSRWHQRRALTLTGQRAHPTFTGCITQRNAGARLSQCTAHTPTFTACAIAVGDSGPSRLPARGGAPATATRQNGGHASRRSRPAPSRAGPHGPLANYPAAPNVAGVLGDAVHATGPSRKLRRRKRGRARICGTPPHPDVHGPR